MRQRYWSFSIIIVLFLGGANVHAQQVIISAGGNANASQGSVSYSVGQIAYSTNINATTFSQIEGVQQPFEISVVTEVSNTDKSPLKISAFPNPTMDHLIVKIQDDESNNTRSFQLFNAQGHLLQKAALKTKETLITTNKLPAAIYFLEILENNQKIKVFKIIKN